MAFCPNEEQKAAIELRNMELLVSASAGAGKTGSLCRRIVERLCDKTDPTDLSRVLVVTFTRAAAGEMRTRIGEELRGSIALLAKEQTKESEVLLARLREQLLLLPLARIGTIDSFCLDLIKSNFDLLDISASVRVADETELKRTKEGIMRRCMGRLYKEDPVLFGQLTDGLLSVYGDEELPGTLISFYEKTLSYEGGISCLLEASALARADGQRPYFESESGRIAGERTLSELDFYIGEYGQYLAFAAGDTSMNKQYEFVKKEQEMLISLREILKEDPEEFARMADEQEFATLPSSRDKSPQRLCFKQTRDSLKAFIKDGARLGVDYDLSSNGELLNESAELLLLYHRLFARYKRELDARKKRMGVLEFSDILLLAERLLYNEDGTISDFARSVALDFDEIYIDEFQDVNALQERVFQAISRGNRFLVGDVKQSIYGFRGACPDIFSGMREELPLYTEGTAAGKLFLSYNYRSDPAIIDFVNAVCGRLLGCCSDMAYVNEDDLKAGKTGSSGVKPRLCLIENSKKSKFLQAEPNKEAAYTAKCIKAMIDKGRAPSDIMVLVRARNDHLSDLIAALEREGVAVDAGQGDDFFESPEILLVTALLEAIDNPTHDIALAAILKSPVFGFTLEQLLEMRRGGSSETLFSCLAEYAEKSASGKAQKALAFLLRYRALSRELTVEKLIWHLYDSLSLAPLLGLGLPLEEGQRIGQRLLCFYDLACGYVRCGGGDVGGFLEHLEGLAKSKAGGENDKQRKDPSKVRIMTFHGSKGLQAPVCWLYGCGKSLSLAGKSIPFDKTFGPGFLLVDKENGVLQSKSSFYYAIRARTLEKGLNEELRLLYVALTRASEQLYISGVATGKLMELQEYAGQIHLKRGHLELLHTPCYLGFLMMALAGREELYERYVGAFPGDLLSETGTLGGQPQEKVSENAPQGETSAPDTALAERYKDRLTFSYPYARAVDIPAKLSVSRLSPGLFDEDAQQPVLPSYGREEPRPRFYEEAPEKSHSATAIGTATHAFMQFCDFEAVEQKGVGAEIKRLLEKGFLDKHAAALVDEKAVGGFFESDLYAALKKAKRVYREQRFMYDLPASALAEQPENQRALAGETVVVQGVIDCFFIDEEGRVVLIDYKTDRFSSAQKKDPRVCEELLRLRHGRQLGYYKAAVEGLTGLPVSRTLIYSFDLGKSLSADPEE